MAMNALSLNHTAVVEFLQGLKGNPHDYRCVCGRVLGRGRLIPGSSWRTRCPSCNRMVIVDASLEVTAVKESINPKGVSNGKDSA